MEFTAVVFIVSLLAPPAAVLAGIVVALWPRNAVRATPAGVQSTRQHA